MSDKINTYGKPGPDVSQARARSVQQSERAAASTAKQRPAAARDSVRITDTAANLKRIEARLASQPEVDEARVSAVRRRIEAGEFRVDPAELARKLLKLEQDLS